MMWLLLIRRTVWMKSAKGSPEDKLMKDVDMKDVPLDNV